MSSRWYCRSAPRPQRSTKLTGGRDGRDALFEELVVGVLERDHDLRIILVRIDLALERRRGAESK